MFFRAMSHFGMTALLVVFCSASLASAQTTGVWSGAANGNWSTAANWSGGIPNASDATAQFGSDSSTTNVNLDAAVALQRLDFLGGAQAHTLASSNSSVLTISRADNDAFISNLSTSATQTISANIVLARSSGGSFNNDVATGATLTLSGQLRATTGSGNRDVSFRGDGTSGGTVNINGTFSNLTSLRARDGVTINFNPTSTASLSNIWADASGRINILTNPLSARTLTLTNDNAQIWIQRTGTTNTADINMRGTGGGVKTFGADLESGQAATVTVDPSKKLNLNHTDNVANTTFRFSTKANTTLILDAVIHDATASKTGTKVEITGGGAVRFSGENNNTSKTPIVVSAGRLELNKTNGATAIASGGSVTVNQNAELRLMNSDQIANDVALTLDGGRFTVDAFTESLGQLTVSNLGGNIFLSASGTVTFGSLGTLDGTLTIYGWSESASVVFTDITNWNTATLAKITFDGFGQGAVLDGNELIAAAAIPEPSTWIALAGAIALSLTLLARHRTPRRRQC